jgi:hypothetical protein
MPRRKLPARRKLPPWNRHHQPWCAIFYGRFCDCDDDFGPPRRRRPLSDRDRELGRRCVLLLCGDHDPGGLGVGEIYGNAWFRS